MMDCQSFPYPADFTAEGCRFLTWEAMTGEVLIPFLGATDVWAKKDISEGISQTRAAALPFYPGVQLVAITFAEGKGDHFCLVRNGELMAWLDGTNEPIYRLNETLPIRLSQEHVSSYIRFFFHFVRGSMGGFDIVEAPDDVRWAETAPVATKETIGAQLMPLTYLGLDKAGFFRLTGTVLFRDALFRTDILVAARATVGPPGADADERSPFEVGVTALTNEVLLAEDLPVMSWLPEKPAASKDNNKSDRE